MSDDFGKRAEDKAKREGERFVDHPTRTSFKWLGILVAAIVVLSLTFGLTGWIGGWFSGAAKTTGFDNTKLQYTAVKGDYQGMRAAAANACGAEKTQTDANSPTFVEDPALAYKAKYREIEADYNRRMENNFEAGIVGPDNLPDVAPTLEEMQLEVC